jgi:hypothetical protein
MAVAVGRLPGVSASATARADRDASLCEELAVRIDGADLRASAWRARLELAVTLMAAIVNEERFGLYRERCRGDY